MSTPTIPAGNLYMNDTLWTGNGGTQTITNGVAGQNFQPDLVWIKNRSSAYDHVLTNSVVGAQLSMASNTTAAESSDANGLTAFTSTGFSVGSAVRVNNSGNNIVGWQWKAGGTAVSNTAGSITSQVSANTTSGFSVVTYTGNGTNLATVGHGVGAAPYFVIIRRRDTGQNWLVDISNITGTTGNVLTLNTTNAVVTSTTIAPVKPSSTVLTLGTDGLSNASGGTYVAYCWAPIAGYSQFGSYTGNGSSNGPFIYLGFQPKFFMFKNASSGSTNWYIFDSSRGPYNLETLRLNPNVSDAEGTESTSTNACYFLSNGVQVGGSGTNINGSGNTIIYAAFASNPFKYSNAF